MFEYNKKSIGSRIRKIRKSQNMTLKEFSEILDVPISSISSWERGVNVPSTQNLELISNKTGVDSNWILYGDIADYIQDVFDYYQLNDIVNESTFFELERALIDMEFTPGNLNEFIKIAELIIPKFKELIEYEENDQTLSIHMLNNEFPILQSKEFQMSVLPILQSLLTDEDEKENRDIILFLFDLLSRMNKSTKSKTKTVFRDINWLLSNNIFRLERKYQSNEPSFGGISSSDVYNKQTERSYENVKKDSDEIIKEISNQLQEIVEINYKEFQKREHKSIF